MQNSPLRTVLNVQATRYIQVASLTLVLYDHFLTFPNEVDLVWRGATTKSWPRVLFFAARYACPIALSVNTVALFGRNTDEVSRGWLFFLGWSGYAFFAGVQVISQMRLWAIYRSMKLLISMAVFHSMALVAMGLIAGFGYAHLEGRGQPVPNLFVCGPRTLPHYVYAFWLPPILVETVSVALVLHKAMAYFREETPREWVGSRLMVSIVRLSVVYFVIVLAVYLANFFVWLLLPINAFALFIPLTYALPSVAGTRMLLSLRSIFYTNHALLPGQDDTISLTVMHPDRGLTVHTHNPMKEFDSFFGESSPS